MVPESQEGPIIQESIFDEQSENSNERTGQRTGPCLPRTIEKIEFASLTPVRCFLAPLPRVFSTRGHGSGLASAETPSRHFGICPWQAARLHFFPAKEPKSANDIARLRCHGEQEMMEISLWPDTPSMIPAPANIESYS